MTQPTSPSPEFYAEYTPAAPPAALPRPPLRLSCVVPAFNEAVNLPRFIPALAEAVAQLTPHFEIVIVNDGSTDATHTVAMELVAHSGLPLRYLALSRNFGKEAALSAGIDHTRGNAVVLIDGDFQHPLDLLPEMHALWQRGYDMVYGVIADRGAESGAKRVGTHLFYRIMNAGNSVKMPPNAGDYRWLDRKVANALKALPERHRFMKGLYAWVGFKTAALPFVPLDRAAGASSFNLRRLGSLALLGLTSFTTLPLMRPGSALNTARAPRARAMMRSRVAGEPISSSHEKNRCSGAFSPPQRAKASATNTLSTRPDFMSATPGP